ncbi:MAG: hypothetical protein ACI9KE_004792 [Polyangiales bacterium]|jgi:hypothetical protein
MGKAERTHHDVADFKPDKSGIGDAGIMESSKASSLPTSRRNSLIVVGNASASATAPASFKPDLSQAACGTETNRTSDGFEAPSFHALLKRKRRWPSGCASRRSSESGGRTM